MEELYISSVNLWISLLEFTRQIVIALLAAPDLESRRGIRPKQGNKFRKYDLITEITLSITLKPNDDVQIATNVTNRLTCLIELKTE